MYQETLATDLVDMPGALAEEFERFPSCDSVSFEYRRAGLAGISADADAVFLDVRESEAADAIARMLEASPRARHFVIAWQKQLEEIEPYLDGLEDVWVGHMRSPEARFRIERWQRAESTKLKLWETDQFLESTINSIPSLVWYKSADGIHHKVNDSFCTTVNKTKEQVQGRGHAYIWDVEADDPACIESEAEVMSKRKTFISEERIMTGEGERILTTYKSPLYTPYGDVMGTVGVGIDITQERAYEEDLISKNRMLESIFKALDVGVITHSLDGNTLYSANQAALDIIGMDSEESFMDGHFKMIADTVIDEDKDKLFQAIRSLEEPGEAVNIEYRALKDGRIIHILGNIKIVEEGGRRYYQRLLLDISERIAREEEFKERQRNLVQALAEDFFISFAFDLDNDTGSVLRVSSANEELLSGGADREITLEEFLNEYVSRYVYEEDREDMLRALSKDNLLHELKDCNSFHEMYREKHNDEFDYCEAAVVRTPAWQSDHEVVLGLRSIDSQIRQELEQRELLEAALDAANKASRAKSSFLSNMSHDIRTPMNAIVGFSSLAQNHIHDNDVVVDYLDKIQKSSSHLVDLINVILDMSRIENGKITISEGECDLKELVTSIYDLLENEAREGGIDLKLDVSGMAQNAVMCDELRLKQVMLNLAGNAIKFTPKGGSVTIIGSELISQTSDDIKFQFMVKDTGIGISREFLEHIFEPFERERSSTISRLEGSGLGMAISKSLVDMMHGTISVESEPGVGTNVKVVVPLTLIDAPQALDHSEDHKPIHSKRDYYSGHILLVDDNALNREIARTLLEDEGFNIESAEDGRSAIDMLLKHEPGYFNLILMDIQMPIMNGYEAAKIIRSLPDERLSKIPIFAVTADAFEEDRQKALSAGMNGHLSKPIDIQKLFEILDKVFQ